MASQPPLVGADGVTPLRQLLSREIAGAQLGSTRSVLTAFPAEGLEPGRLAAILRAAADGDIESYLELAEQMEERYPHYASVLGTRKRQVAQLDITVEAASDDPLDQAKADLVRDWLRRDTLEAELFDILDAVGKGFSVTEIVWNTRRTPWLPERLIWRDPRWFEFRREDLATPLLRGGVKIDGSAGGGPAQPLPPFKFIVHAHPAKSGIPIRGGLARPAAWAYLFQNLALKDWVGFAEIYGFPIRVGRYEPGASEENIRTLMRAVANVSRDAAAVIPSSMQMEFISAQATGGADVFERLCQYLDRQVSKLVLGQTATTDSEGGGLGGSGKEHNDVRGDIERADAKLLAATLNRDLVKPIIDFNFGAPADGAVAMYPTITIGRPEKEDLKAELEAIGEFVDRGGRVEASVVRDKLKLPDPPPGAVLLQPLTGATGIGPAGALPGTRGPVMPGNPAPGLLDPLKPSYRPIAPATAATAAAPAPADDIDLAVAALVDDGWEAVMEPIVGPLRAALATAGSYEEMATLLLTALPSADVQPLADRLERAAFAIRAAAVTGASDVGNG